jgi:hypothetical protein
VNPGAIRIDLRAAEGVFCLLWGEPGRRWGWGLVFLTQTFLGLRLGFEARL